MGPVGRALPDPRRGDVTQEGTLPPQVTDGPADQGTAARPAALAAAVDAARAKTAEVLLAAQATAPGQEFTAAGQTLRRPVMTRHGTSAKVWAEDPAAGRAVT